MSHRETASAIVIDTSGRFLFQQRDDVPYIQCPGKVGLFGGHRENEESFLQCMVRELSEELSYSVPAERFEHLLSHTGPDLDLGTGTLQTEFFIVYDIPAHALNVTEGSLLAVEPANIHAMNGEILPMTWIAINAFFAKHPIERKQPTTERLPAGLPRNRHLCQKRIC